MTLRPLFGLVAVGLCSAAEKPVDFNREVRPILSDNCFACHGPDEKRRMAGVRLDTEDGLARAADRIVTRISAPERSRRMPPAPAAVLTDAQVAVIRKWVEQGAKWERHWSFTAPRRPELPAVSNPRWARNPIDRFVMARLDREELKPSPEADRTTLLRRVSFDLTGLPPSPAEIDAFLADKSANAYEKQVDRLLAMPQYGERMAMQWLDLARYADTHGYHIDSHRDMWKWRDWVIDAFNSNLPFDRFGIEQLAGDLLPNATVQQRLATGFNRNHMINYEGGAIPEEYHAEYVADRVDTTANVFMGLTVGCARCHDHKFDPIPQKDYYRFFAFFNTIAEKGLDGRTGNAAPILELPTAAQASDLAWLQQAIAEHEAALPEKDTQSRVAAWQKTVKLAEAPGAGLLAHYSLDGDLSGGRLAKGAVTFGAGRPGQSATFNGEAQVEFPSFDTRRFAVAMWVRSGPLLETTWIEGGPGFEIGVEDSHPQPDLKRGSPLYFEMGGKRWRSPAIVYGGQWQHVVVNVEDGAPSLILERKPVKMEPAGTAAARAAGPVVIGNPAKEKPFKGEIGGIRIYGRPLSVTETETLRLDEPVRYILATEESKRTREQSQRLTDYFLSYQAPEELRAVYARLNSLKSRLAELKKDVANVQVMAEMAKPRETFILARGDYRNPGEKVTPGVPSMLPPMPTDAPANRLGLAQWLFSRQHPLTARVAVNRYWQLHFGTGLVKTTEDFGSQGDAPAQRDLLDWLATEFQSNWDVKAMQRLIVTSATYRQSSHVTPALLERDPENRLLARGARFRLPAETVRDNALAVSGLLNRRIGGASVFPYQPAGIWEELSRGETFTAQEYHESSGADLYRRSMYTFWKRTVPPAQLSTFDAPDREKCTSRRLTTNTPLQALVLLNDPTYLEASQVLAKRAIAMEATAAGRVRHLFREATGRAPSATESRVLVELAQRRLEHYRQNPAMAAKLKGAEIAAWTVVASTIFNLDETITKE